MNMNKTKSNNTLHTKTKKFLLVYHFFSFLISKLFELFYLFLQDIIILSLHLKRKSCNKIIYKKDKTEKSLHWSAIVS